MTAAEAEADIDDSIKRKRIRVSLKNWTSSKLAPDYIAEQRMYIGLVNIVLITVERK